EHLGKLLALALQAEGQRAEPAVGAECGLKLVELVVDLLASVVLRAAGHERAKVAGRVLKRLERLLIAEVQRNPADDGFAARLLVEEGDFQTVRQREAFDVLFE